jgi:protein gp37
MAARNLPAMRSLAGEPYARYVVGPDGKKRAEWTGLVEFRPDRLRAPLRWREPKTIFVCPHGDLFHERVTAEQIAAVFGVMAACPQHTFIVPTTRAARRREWYAWLAVQIERSRSVFPDDSAGWIARHLTTNRARHFGAPSKVQASGDAWPPPNVWDLTSCSTQAEVDALWPIAADTPSAHRGLSIEPLIEGVRLDDDRKITFCNFGEGIVAGDCSHGFGACRPRTHLDYAEVVIAGGESGSEARPCDVAWLRSLRDQCKAAGVPFMCKQLGTRPLTLARECGRGGPIEGTEELAEMLLVDDSGADPSEWPADLRVRELPWKVRA